jgi:hypothetical protein
MKSFISVIIALLGNRSSRSNLKTLLRLLSVLFVLVTIYSVVFHYLMEREGQQFSWITGLYWTLTVMTTLGFGDITFHGDLGRLFSIVVLGTGVMFLLVILPFTFIEFFYAPWMKAQASARTPRELPEDTRNHVIFTSHDPVTVALIPMLDKFADRGGQRRAHRARGGDPGEQPNPQPHRRERDRRVGPWPSRDGGT